MSFFQQHLDPTLKMYTEGVVHAIHAYVYNILFIKTWWKARFNGHDFLSPLQQHLHQSLLFYSYLYSEDLYIIPTDLNNILFL